MKDYQEYTHKHTKLVWLAYLQQRKAHTERTGVIGKGIWKVWPCAGWVKGGISEEVTHGMGCCPAATLVQQCLSSFCSGAGRNQGSWGPLVRNQWLLNRKDCLSSGSCSVASGMWERLQCSVGNFLVWWPGSWFSLSLGIWNIPPLSLSLSLTHTHMCTHTHRGRGRHKCTDAFISGQNQVVGNRSWWYHHLPSHQSQV